MGAAVISEALAAHQGLRALYMPANVIGPSTAKRLAEAIATNISLEVLDLNSNAFGVIGGVALSKALAQSAGRSGLKRLSLTACGVGVDSAVQLAETLSGDSGHGLTALDMTTNFIGPEGVAAFAAMLHSNTTLAELSLSDNNIGQLGDRTTGTCGTALAAALEANTTLRVLDLTFNGLSDAATQTLVGAKQRSDARRETPLELLL
eukprot:3234918-Prymnesium_polylepis.1